MLHRLLGNISIRHNGKRTTPRPPQATSTRVVVPICTRPRIIGTRLHIVHKEGVSALPAPLHDTPISQQAYQEKLQLLEQRLGRWKGGWATMAVLLLALSVVLAFIAAYFIPAFWSSVLFSDPVFIFSFAIFQLVFFTVLIRYTRREALSLQRDITNLYREWRSDGIYVTMTRVQGAATRSYGGQRMSGSNCFCVVIDVLNEEQAAQRADDGSVSTVGTVDSQDSIVENHGNEGSASVELPVNVV